MFNFGQKKEQNTGNLNQTSAKEKQELAILRGIQTAMPNPYYVRDMDYNIISWTKAAERLTGYTAEEALNMKCYDIFKAEVCQECPTQQRIISKKFFKDAPVTIYKKDGSPVMALCSIAGVYDENEQPLGAVEMFKDVSDYRKLLESIDSNAQQLSAVAQELAASSEEVSSLSSTLKEDTGFMAEIAGAGFITAQDVQTRASQCNELTGQVESTIQEINTSMKNSVNRIDGLKEKSARINDVVTAIREIADQTNLLSLNASIEAARAGDSGRGFAVVAQEIRKLSESSTHSATEIKDTITEIVSLIQETTAYLKSTERDILSGGEVIKRLLDYIGEISASSDKLSEHTGNIKAISAETAQMSIQQASAIDEVAKASQELTTMALALQAELGKIKLS